MKMKDFKAALKAKLKFAEENCKTNDDYYLGYISAMEDILVYIEGSEEDEGLSTHDGNTCERGL